MRAPIIKGISFPFRIGVVGGVVMSSVSNDTYLHAIEAMQQIILTRFGERVMNFNFGSNADASVFTPNDISGHTLLAHDVKNALEEHYSDVSEIKSVEIVGKDNSVFARVNFSLKPFEGIFSADLKVGEDK